MIQNFCFFSWIQFIIIKEGFYRILNDIHYEQNDIIFYSKAKSLKRENLRSFLTKLKLWIKNAKDNYSS